MTKLGTAALSHFPEPANPVDNLSQLMTYRWSRIQSKLNMHASRALQAATGLSLTHWRVLVVVHAQKCTTASDVSKQLGWDKGLLSRNIKQMVKNGLLTIKASQKDSRVQLLSLSPAGLDIYKRTLPHMDARQATIRDILDTEEQEMLFRVMDKMDTFLTQELEP